MSVRQTTQTATTAGPVPGAFDPGMQGRLEFWRGVADTFGVSDSAVDEALVRLAPLTVVDVLLPGRSEEERSEVMWALGEFERRSHGADQHSTTHPCAAACAGDCRPAA